VFTASLFWRRWIRPMDIMTSVLCSALRCALRSFAAPDGGNAFNARADAARVDHWQNPAARASQHLRRAHNSRSDHYQPSSSTPLLHHMNSISWACLLRMVRGRMGGGTRTPRPTPHPHPHPHRATSCTQYTHTHPTPPHHPPPHSPPAPKQQRKKPERTLRAEKAERSAPTTIATERVLRHGLWYGQRAATHGQARGSGACAFTRRARSHALAFANIAHNVLYLARIKQTA